MATKGMMWVFRSTCWHCDQPILTTDGGSTWRHQYRRPRLHQAVQHRGRKRHHASAHGVMVQL